MLETENRQLEGFVDDLKKLAKEGSDLTSRLIEKLDGYEEPWLLMRCFSEDHELYDDLHSFWSHAADAQSWGRRA